MKVFDTPLAALYFAEREPDLKFAELWEEGRSLCELRKIDLPSGSIWQVTPMAHLPPQAQKKRQLATRKPALSE